MQTMLEQKHDHNFPALQAKTSSTSKTRVYFMTCGI